MSNQQKPSIDLIQSAADPATSAKKLTQVALRRSVMKRTVDQIFDSEEREEIEEEMQENDEIAFTRYPRNVRRTLIFPDVRFSTLKGLSE